MTFLCPEIPAFKDVLLSMSLENLVCYLVYFSGFLLLLLI
jgi:hypothetical protein